MHIVFSVNSAWNLINFRRPLIEAFVNEGHRVTAVAPADPLSTTLNSMGCAFQAITMDVKGLSAFRDVSAFLDLRSTFKQMKPDLIFSYTIKNNIYGALAARSLGIPFVPNVTGLGTAFLSGGPLQRAAQLLYRNAFRSLPIVFFQNPDDLDLFVRRRLVLNHQARLLPGSGIDLSYFSPRPSPGREFPVFLMIARLIRDKGVMEFAEASRTVRASYPGARFQLLGPLDALNRTAITPDLLATWIRSGCIEYLGETDDVRPHIAACDCVVLPSYREGAPRTLIEAAAMGRPAITTDVPGCRSVVEDGLTGFMCDPRSGESLAAACVRFIGLRNQERAAMALAARIKMEQEFSQERVVEGYRQAVRDMFPACGALTRRRSEVVTRARDEGDGR